MRCQINESGYVMWLSANDTYQWANRPGESWPCSTTANKRLRVDVDSNGLCDLMVDGRCDLASQVDGNELEAIVTDHMPDMAKKFWPTWK